MMRSKNQVTDNLDSIVATLGPVLGVGLTLGKRWLTIHSDVIGLSMSYLTTQVQALEEQGFSKVYDCGSVSGFVR